MVGLSPYKTRVVENIARPDPPRVLIAFAAFLILSVVPACASAQDSVKKVSMETSRILAAYERTKDPKEVRAWLTEYHGEAQGHEVMLIFADWSLSHQADFTKIVEGFGKEKRDEFAERFAFALVDSESDERFRKAFVGYKSEAVDLVLTKLSQG